MTREPRRSVWPTIFAVVVLLAVLAVVCFAVYRWYYPHDPLYDLSLLDLRNRG